MDWTGASIGPFRVRERIGLGAMSSVYRAEQPGTGLSVALKIVEALQPEHLRAMRREIGALSGLQHPGIVRIVAEGLHESVPWYAMELIEGQTLSPEGGLTPERLRTLAAVGRTLAWLHGEGIVHRDLKPRNILVRPDGRPVLLDFGLVSRFAGAGGREAWQIGETGAGTLEYMAPEQIRGELTDARADLYALGCVLYEMAVGQPPFTGPPARVLRGHTRQAPDFGGFQHIDPRFTGLLQRLLAKQPQHRLGPADTVAVLLEELAGIPPCDPGPRPRPSLYRPALAGRVREMAWLQQQWEAAAAGDGRFVLVTGQPGIGKTRLALELARIAATRGTVLAGAGVESGPRSGLQPFRAFLQAAADRCHAPAEEAWRGLLSARAAWLAVFQPELAPFCGPLPEPGRFLPQEACQQIADSLGDLLEGWGRPLCLILDDLHGADEWTVGVLQHLLETRRLARLPVGLFGFARTGEASVGEDFAGPRLVVERLGAEDLEPLVCDMLGVPEAPAGLLEFLARQSEGNPWFVAEYLRAAVAAGLLVRDQEGGWGLAAESDRGFAAGFDGLSLPGTLQELLHKRLERLAPEVRDCAARAALLGRRFDPALLEALAPSPAEGIRAALRELCRAQILEILPDETLRFGQDRIRDALLAGLDPARRAALHRQTATFLQQSTGWPGLGPSDLAQHWLAAGDPASAAPHALEAGREALRRHALLDAERWYRVYLGLSEAPASPRIQAAAELGHQLMLWGRGPEARVLLQSALAEAEGLGEAQVQGSILCTLGECDWREARPQAARDRFLVALALVRRSGDRKTEALLLDRLANIAHALAQPEAAFQLFHEALALHEQLGDRRGQALSLTNLAVFHQNRGRLEAAEPLYRRALDLHRAVGHRRLEGGTLGNLGIAYQESGRLAEAETTLQQALQIIREVGDRRTEGILLVHLALAGEGCRDTTRSLFQQALELLSGMAPQAEGEALCAYGALLLRQGEGDEALRWVVRASEKLEQAGGGVLLVRPWLEWARIHRLWLDQPAAALLRLHQAEALCAGDRNLRVLCQSEAVHARLALGQPLPLPQIDLDDGLAFEARTALEHARKASQAARLLRGSCAEALPPALRRNLLRSGARPRAGTPAPETSA